MVRARRTDAAGAAAMLVAAATLVLIATSSLGVRPEAKLGILYEYHTPGGYAGAEEDYDALVAPSTYFATDEKGDAPFLSPASRVDTYQGTYHDYAGGEWVNMKAGPQMLAGTGPEVVYVSPREMQNLLAQRQGLDVIWNPESQTDMWLKVAEAIDKDRVNNPALPPVSDAISAEAKQAQAEQQAERDAQKKWGANQNPGMFGAKAPLETLVIGGEEFALVPVIQE